VTEAVLVSNGPGELYTWVRPVLKELRSQNLKIKTTICLIPCQFAAGDEAVIARTFGADGVTTPNEFVKFMATGRRPSALGGDDGFVLSLGGNQTFALRLARKLGYPTYRYHFVPSWHRGLRTLFVQDKATEEQARRKGAPRDRIKRVGNLVADAVDTAAPSGTGNSPQILLLPGSRNSFAVTLIPFFLALADQLGKIYPSASFAWPVSRLLSERTLEDGIAAKQPVFPGSISGSRKGTTITTPSGTCVEMVLEAERYQHMRSADLAVTIPGTNTLELGIAGVPSIVLLPMNKPETIPLEGIGHWLSLIPFVGTPLKRYAVQLFVNRLSLPISLPNRIAGKEIMLEVRGILSVAQVMKRITALIDDPTDLSLRRRQLLATMPKPGAARKLVAEILSDLTPRNVD
jgi:hypothetical protein